MLEAFAAIRSQNIHRNDVPTKNSEVVKKGRGFWEYDESDTYDFIGHLDNVHGVVRKTLLLNGFYNLCVSSKHRRTLRVQW